jgi:hypothetical protein
MQWLEPRNVDEFVWLYCELRDGTRMVRYGTVSWQRVNPGLYSVSITYQSEHGLGLYCWPKFRALSDAQDFVEQLMGMSSTEAKKIHGTQWPNVIL